jgi:P pilus assembly chaperone PapD
MKTMSRKKRGIGELLAALIIIGITIIAGVVVYDVLFARMNTIGYTPGVTIQESTIANDQAFITVKNTGTYTISSVSVTVYYNGQSVGTGSSGSMQPGQTVAISPITLSASGFTYQPGETFTVYVTANYNGGQVSTSAIVIGE